MADDDVKRLKDELHEMEIMVNAILENSPDCILTVTPKLAIVYFNREIVGVSESQAVGMNVCGYLPPEQNSAMKDALEQVFRTGEFRRLEIPLKKQDGSSIEYTVKIAPVKDGQTVVAAILVFTDITAKKRLEKENSSLASQVSTLSEGGKKFSSETTGLKTQLESLLAEYYRYKAQAEQEKSSLSAEVSSLAKDRTRIPVLEKEKSELAVEVGRLSSENEKLEQAEQENVALNIEVRRLAEEGKQFSSLQQENSELKERISGFSEKEKALQGAYEENGRLKSQNSVLSLELEAEKGKVSAASTQMDAMSRDLEGMRRHSKEMEDWMSKIGGEQDEELKADLATLQSLSDIIARRMREVSTHLEGRKKSE